MLQTASIVLPFFIADVLNPVLFAVMVYATGSGSPALNSIAVLLGHTVAKLFVGITVALGLERIAHFLDNPSGVGSVVALIVGLLLIWHALPFGKKRDESHSEKRTHITLASGFKLGATVNLAAAPFALLYFGGIDQMIKADLSAFEVVVFLAIYNLLYSAIFLIVPGTIAILGDKGQVLLKKINTGMTQASSSMMPYILGLAGFALVSDAVFYFATGKGLF